jgi:hypothetical protein
MVGSSAADVGAGPEVPHPAFRSVSQQVVPMSRYHE